MAGDDNSPALLNKGSKNIAAVDLLDTKRPTNWFALTREQRFAGHSMSNKFEF